MSQENVEMVRQMFLAPGPLTNAPHIAPNAEFDFTAVYPDQPVLRGLEEMRRPEHSLARWSVRGDAGL